MSEEKRVRYFVRNQQNQPVELHLRGGVKVLGPREEAEVGGEALSEPQMKVFQKLRLVTARQEAAAEEPAAPGVKERGQTETREQEEEAK